MILKNNRNLNVLIDEEDYDRVKNYTWYILKKSSGNYVGRSEYIQPYNGKIKRVYLHREIMNAPKGTVVDHINRDTLDNRKCNLRLCSHAENLRNAKIHSNNTSGYIGVYYRKKSGRWFSIIQTDGISKSLGTYDTKEEAARVYDKAAKLYHKEFAKLNFPDEDIK